MEELSLKKKSLSNLGVPIMPVPENVEEVLKTSSESLISVSDPEVALAVQHKMAQFTFYIRQQYNMYKSKFNEENEKFEDALYKVTSQMPKGWTVRDKTANALSSNDELRKVKKEVNSIKEKVDLLSDLDSKAELIHDVAKQLYYRLARNDFRDY